MSTIVWWCARSHNVVTPTGSDVVVTWPLSRVTCCRDGVIVSGSRTAGTWRLRRGHHGVLVWDDRVTWAAIKVSAVA